jgi:DNA-binding IclR family transcriptional regulator
MKAVPTAGPASSPDAAEAPKKTAAAKKAVAAMQQPAAAEGPRSPQRVMQALSELAASAEGLPLTRLSERLKTPKTSLLNLLRSLEAAGYVSQSNNLYQLGAKTLRLGLLIAARVTPESSISSRLRPFLKELMEKTGETTLLGVMGDDRRHGVYIDIVEGRGAIRFSSVLGTHRPLFCSAFGKALLAFSDATFIDGYLGSTDLVLPNGGRRLRKAQVLAMLSAIRSAGVSSSHEEIDEGAGGIAAPVFDREGRVACVLAVAAPIGRLKAHEVRWTAILLDVAARASASLGYSGRVPGH